VNHVGFAKLNHARRKETPVILVEQFQVAVHVPPELQEHKSVDEIIEAFDFYDDDDARINFELSMSAHNKNRGENK
jgi:hypothetical protein